MQSSRVQNYFSDLIERELSAKIKSTVSIESVNYKLFNRLSIKKLYVSDQRKDTLLYIDHTYLDFDLLRILSGDVVFRAVELNQLRGHIVKFRKGGTNLDFLIEAFKTPENKKSNVSYRISDFTIKNSTLSYKVETDSVHIYKSRFNPTDIQLTNLNAAIGLNNLNKDTLNLDVKNISFNEKSGFELNEFSTSITANQKGGKISHIDIKLPNTNLTLNDITFRYDSLGPLKKNIYDGLKFNIPVSKSEIYLSDLSAFVPAFEHLVKPVELSTTISGSIANLKVKDLSLKHGRTLKFKTDIELSGLPDIEQAFVYTNIKNLAIDKSEIQDVISKITHKPFVLPKELNNLGIVNYKGNITGLMNNLVAYGKLKTDIGNISTDILLKFDNAFKDIEFNGKLSTNSLKLKQLLNSKDLGNLTMNVTVSGRKKEKTPLKGTINGKINSLELLGYNYTGMVLNGKFDGTGFDGKFNINDPNIIAGFQGIVDLTKKKPIYKFNLDVTDANLYAMNLVKNIEDFTLSFNAVTNLTGKNADDINGNLQLNNIALSTPATEVNIDQFSVISRIQNNFTNIVINSDIINGSLTGDFTYSKLPAIVNDILKKYIPSLSNLAKKTVTGNNYVDVNLNIANINELAQIFKLPLAIDGTASIKGTVSNVKNKIRLEGNVPGVHYSNMNFEGVALKLDNEDQKLRLETNASMLQKNNTKTHISLAADALNDTLFTKLNWLSSGNILHESKVSAVTHFKNEKGQLSAKLDFHPSELYISDSLWTISKSTINFNVDSTLTIKDFRLERGLQFLHVNGFLSKRDGNDLNLDMKDLDLGFVMTDILKLKSVIVDGTITGKATILSKDKQPVIQADLFVKNASLNDKSIGDARILSKWDKVNSQILFDAGFTKNGTDTAALAYGIYKPSNDSLDIVFDMKGLSIAFLQRYFDGVVDNVKGDGFGKIRMYGPTKSIGFEGKALIRDAQMRVCVLNTYYNFTDSVKLTRKTIEMDNIRFYDAERNSGYINGIVRHDGHFTKMKYDVNLKGTNIIGMDTQAKDNDFFYGKAYATGTVKITGNDNECNIVVNAETQPKSKGYFNMGSASTASDNSFITFVNPAADGTLPAKPVVHSRFNTKVDLNIDVTNDAEMKLLIDPKGGDNITGRGNGSLRVNFDTFSDIKLYGTYTIDYGYYYFTLQSIVRKDFNIDQGSTISWTGDPFGAKVDIRAIYPLTASLTNILDASDISNSTRRSSVPVNCVLKLTDDLMSPKIKFDIDLPTADESLKQKVRNVVNTEEMLNRQIAYLLAFNSFYNPQQVANANQATFNSFLTSTLSAHLNNFIHKTIKSDMLSLGFDMQQTDISDTQYKAQVMIQPNDRIILNSNVGYRVDNYTQNPEDKYMLDFDFEYLLTKNGKLRFKAYSHTIDRSQLKDAKTTQGLGLVYKEDFQSFAEMFKYYWQKFTFKNTSPKDSVQNK